MYNHIYKVRLTMYNNIVPGFGDWAIDIFRAIILLPILVYFHYLDLSKMSPQKEIILPTSCHSLLHPCSVIISNTSFSERLYIIGLFIYCYLTLLDYNLYEDRGVFCLLIFSSPVPKTVLGSSKVSVNHFEMN